VKREYLLQPLCVSPLKGEKKIPRLFKAGVGVVTQSIIAFHLTLCLFEGVLKSSRISIFGHTPRKPRMNRPTVNADIALRRLKA